MVPRGAVLLDNPNGTAPGLWLEHGRTAIVLLPGPPREMKPMFEAVVRDRLAPRSGGAGLFRRVIKITGRTESDVDATVQPIYGAVDVAGRADQHDDSGGARADRTASDGRGAPTARMPTRALDAAVQELQAALGDAIYSVDGVGARGGRRRSAAPTTD